jgi:hypothetical protein
MGILAEKNLSRVVLPEPPIQCQGKWREAGVGVPVVMASIYSNKEKPWGY